MKKLFFLFLSLAITGGVWATGADPNWITMEQPDGSTIHLRLMGDEVYHYWMNQDGLEVEKNDAGYWVVAKKQMTAQQRQKRRASSPMCQEAAPRKAAARPEHVLVILVNFPDIQFANGHDSIFYDAMLNKLDSLSAREYFKQSSDGHYTPYFDVWGPVMMDSVTKYYGGDDANGNDMRDGCMIYEACIKAQMRGCNFAKYDEDKDGTVDNINVIFAGYAEASTGNGDHIWPNKWNLKDCRNCGSSPSYYTLDGKKLYTYSCSQERSGSSGTNSTGIGTFCHEFSHVIGMPDYYDTSYGDNNQNKMTPGRWTLMDAGNYNGNGHNPPLYSVFDKCYMGWAETPELLAKDAELDITMPAGTQYTKTITGGTEAKHYTSTDTIYYLENRPQTGWFDCGLPYGGMLIWRVIYKNSWGAVNNVANELHYTLLSATGSNTQLGWGRDCYPGPANVISKMVWPGCVLTDIAYNDNIITFKYNGGKQIKLNHTWMADGSVFANTISTTSLSLPDSEPSACSDDRTFYGWTRQEMMQKDGSDLTTSQQYDVVGQDTTFFAVYRSSSTPYRYFYLCHASTLTDTAHYEVRIIPGNTYTWKGRVLDTPGDYFDTIKTVRGDSIEALHLSYVPEERLVKIYFYNTPKWSNVTYHAWSKTNTTKSPYPNAVKEPITHDGYTIWSHTFEEGFYENILFLCRADQGKRTKSLNDLANHRGQCLNTNSSCDSAWWTPVPTQNYKVTFGKGTGGATVTATGAAALTSGKYVDSNTSVTFTQTAATGYQFKEWNTKQDGSGTRLSTDATYVTTITGALTVYAIFQPKTFTITYKDQNNGNFSGTHVDGYPTTHTYATETTLKTAYKENYVFEGWYTSQNCETGIVNKLGAKAYTANITLYAKWRAANKVTVYFYNYYDWDVVRYHAWGGWKASTLWPGVIMTLTDTTHNGHQVYRASFLESEYERLMFTTGSSSIYQTNNLYDISTRFAQNTGLCGYHDTINDPSTWWGTVPTQNYKVTFNANGHGTAPDSAWVDKNGKVTKPANLSELGFVFQGWYKESACLNAWNFSTDVVTSPVTLYAKWRAANMVKIYYYNSYDWDNVYCHAYHSTSGTSTKWPGLTTTEEPLTRDGHKVYSALVDESLYERVIFNNNNGTTAHPKAQTQPFWNVSSNDGKCGYYDLGTNTSAWGDLPTQNYPVTFGYGLNGVSATAKKNGTDAINSGDYVDVGTSVTFGQSPNSGYIIKEWNTQQDGNGTQLSTRADYITTITGVTTAYAIFEAISAPNGAIIGTMNGWTQHDAMTDGAVTIHLTASATPYEFKVLYGAGSSASYYGNNSTMYRNNCSGWTMETDKNNCKILADKTGNYTFTWNNSTKKLSVTYPTTTTRTVYLDLSDHYRWAESNAVLKVNDFNGAEKNLVHVADCVNESLYVATVNDLDIPYEFHRWSSDQSKVWNTATVLLVSPNNTCKMYATNWNAGVATTFIHQHTVTFHHNGHGTAVDARCVTDGQSTTDPELAEYGYTLEGWFKDAGFTDQFLFGTSTVTAATTLYAKWTEHLHKATLAVNPISPAAGTVAITSVAQSSGVTTPITIQATAKQGYHFVGWTYSGISSQKITIADASAATTTVNLQDDGATITANFVAHYAVRGELNDGSDDGGMPGMDNVTPLLFEGGWVAIYPTLQANSTYKICVYDTLSHVQHGSAADNTTLTLGNKYYQPFSGTAYPVLFTTRGAGTYKIDVAFNESAGVLTPKVKIQTYPESYVIPFGCNDGSLGSITAAVNGVTFTSGQYVAQGDDVVFTAEPNVGNDVEGWYDNAACTGSKLQTGGTTYTIHSIVEAASVYAKFQLPPVITHSGSASYQIGGAAIKLTPQYTHVTANATYAWVCTAASGAGATIDKVTFSDTDVPNPSVSASVAGTYTIRVTVTQGTQSAYKDITLTVSEVADQCASCFPQTGSTAQ